MPWKDQKAQLSQSDRQASLTPIQPYKIHDYLFTTPPSWLLASSHTQHQFSLNSHYFPFSLLTRDGIAIYFYFLLLIKDLFLFMDIYRARNILSSKLQKRSLNIGLKK